MARGAEPQAQRRVAEEKQRQDRLQRLQEEAVRSGKQNAAVEMRWAELLDQNMRSFHSMVRNVLTSENKRIPFYGTFDAARHSILNLF